MVLGLECGKRVQMGEGGRWGEQDKIPATVGAVSGVDDVRKLEVDVFVFDPVIWRRRWRSGS